MSLVVSHVTSRCTFGCSWRGIGDQLGASMRDPIGAPLPWLQPEPARGHQPRPAFFGLFCSQPESCLQCSLRDGSTLGVDCSLRLFRSCSCRPDPISLCSKITSVRQGKHCIPLARQGRPACLSRSFLIIHILGLLRETRLCG